MKGTRCHQDPKIQSLQGSKILGHPQSHQDQMASRLSRPKESLQESEDLEERPEERPEDLEVNLEDSVLEACHLEDSEEDPEERREGMKKLEACRPRHMKEEELGRLEASCPLHRTTEEGQGDFEAFCPLRHMRGAYLALLGLQLGWP